jgi:hypothetical protein
MFQAGVYLRAKDTHPRRSSWLPQSTLLELHPCSSSCGWHGSQHEDISLEISRRFDRFTIRSEAPSARAATAPSLDKGCMTWQSTVCLFTSHSRLSWNPSLALYFVILQSTVFFTSHSRRSIPNCVLFDLTTILLFIVTTAPKIHCNFILYKKQGCIP